MEHVGLRIRDRRASIRLVLPIERIANRHGGSAARQIGSAKVLWRKNQPLYPLFVPSKPRTVQLHAAKTDFIIVASDSRIREIVEQAVQSAVQKALDSHWADLQMRRQWLSNGEAMAELGVSRSTLARWRKSGQLPYSKSGSLVFYRRSDIEQMLAAGLRNHT